MKEREIASLDEEMRRRVARYEDRREDWDVFACETEAMVPHDVHNEGDTACALQALLSKTHPERPHYEDERLRDLQAATHTR